jgi:hypothetical protein
MSTPILTGDHHFADGAEVTLTIPTLNGSARLVMRAEIDADGDIRVFLPVWPESNEVTETEYGTVASGILYLAAPDTEEN